MNAQRLVTPETVPHILLVEDDEEIATMVIETLTENGLTAVGVGSAANMDAILKTQSFDLIVLDVMLPGENGFSICRRLRALSTIPIVMLTALEDEINRVVGIELGADDYITKPFHPRELMARIKGLLRRALYGAERPSRQTAMQFAGWQIDPILRELVNPEGVRVLMTTAEFDILLAFCQNPGRVLTREQLLRLTHAGLAGPVERSIDVHISRVRQKIEPNVREPTIIKTVRLGGYMFGQPVEAC
ncbi:response regulator transcription factor [Agrobacterium vitis]|uniref:response regulator transcription factor n=1 Tax=Agrobacterium vitis TaxID=373 RepID=UPI002034A36C|nr:response regulator transcription factor [Agrobacterium vitis]MCM2450254.1 response regulator transcription factor [Agrobacterium vitis]MCM2471243.1 response regulator transcription factor [Agrobacterium vitis]